MILKKRKKEGLRIIITLIIIRSRIRMGTKEGAVRIGTKIIRKKTRLIEMTTRIKRIGMRITRMRL